MTDLHPLMQGYLGVLGCAADLSDCCHDTLCCCCALLTPVDTLIVWFVDTLIGSGAYWGERPSSQTIGQCSLGFARLIVNFFVVG